ncbi:MAG: hypothetical protein ACYCSI_03380 [Solirubrobacteraceae bacterium]
MRRLPHAGWLVGTVTPGTIGRVRLDGMLCEKGDRLGRRVAGGSVCPKDQTGSVPFGAAIVTLMRDPAR